jgi:hypothetical protein
LDTKEDRVEVAYEQLPQPDTAGVFEQQKKSYVVLPRAAELDLENARIDCVGELLAQYIIARLPEPMEAMPLDAAWVRSWLPLDVWFEGFIDAFAQPLENNNWLDRQSSLRRLIVPQGEILNFPGHRGRICPFETSQSQQIGRIVSLARGAKITGGRIVSASDEAVDTLGLGAAMIPFFEHSDPCRLIFGMNIMRHWLPQQTPEPALVQSGYEPNAAEFWCGRNLLTAFISMGADTFEDAILISESGAAHFDGPVNGPVEAGDKFANRHGAKGCIARIVPDAEMPHLPDGTSVEIAYSFMSIPSRMNFGQLREAVMGRLAYAEGRPAIVPPFQALGEDAFGARLAAAGLPLDGMEQLSLGGRELTHRSTVGWVYWGRTHHLAQNKMWATVQPKRCQRQSDAEFFALCQAGAYQTVLEHYNTRSERRPDAATLAGRVAGRTRAASRTTGAPVRCIKRAIVGGRDRRGIYRRRLTLLFFGWFCGTARGYTGLGAAASPPVVS